MHQSGEPQLMGPAGPYHHQMHQMPYHEQMPTTSHPSWHQQYHPMQPPVNYQMAQQMAPQQAAQRPPSRGPSAPPPPPSNQKFRTEQWINNQSWPYAQSPAPPICPSMMSYQGGGNGANDDRMSMLSVNTQMMYPDGQRCYSSNGSTCENVNPEMGQNTVAQMADSAMRSWFQTPDPGQRLHMAKAIKTWVKQEKLANVDPQLLPKYIQQILDIVHDGLKQQPGQLPQAYYAQLFYHLLDTLRTLTRHLSTSPLANLLINIFSQNSEFRELFCNFLRPAIQAEPHMKHCSNAAFDLLNTMIMTVKNEKLRVELAVNLKFRSMVYTLLEYFDPRCPLNFIHPMMFTVVRFIASKDNRLKDSLIWEDQPKDKMPPPSSLIVKLNAVLMKIAQTLTQPETAQNREICQALIQLILRTFDLLIMLLHDSAAIDGYIKVNGMAAICNVIQFPNPDVARAGFKLLVQVSDAKALANVPLEQILPFLMQFIHRSQDDAVVFSGTGFLSNVVAHKQHVKELAIQNNALDLLYMLIIRSPRPLDVQDPLKRQKVVDIICNCLRTLNNLLVPTKNGEARQPSEQERIQICRFTEVEMQRKLMAVLSAENLEANMDKGLLSVMELRSTVLRFFTLLLKTSFVPKDTLLNIIDDVRNQNLVGHVCAAFSWAVRSGDRSPQISTYRQLLIERGVTVLLQLMDYCGAEKQVAQCAYSIECPLNLLAGDQIKPNFMLNVLVLCDRILTHSPATAEIWVVDRPMLEALTNHQTPEIAQAANSLLSRFPDNDLLAGLLSHQFDSYS